MKHREKLIVALDVDSVTKAESLVDHLGETVGFYKIGYELAFSGGLPFASELVKAGKKVFLDMKLHDIGTTVHKAVEAIAKTGVTFLTVHGYPQTMRAAANAAQHSGLKILAVTVLTSYDEADIQAAGYGLPLSELVMLRAQQAVEAGVDGLILSPWEVQAVRQKVGPDLVLVTPGVRPVGASVGDQKRIATPYDALEAGADYLVMGRPITQAPNPKEVAETLQKDIATALGTPA